LQPSVYNTYESHRDIEKKKKKKKKGHVETASIKRFFRSLIETTARGQTDTDDVGIPGNKNFEICKYVTGFRRCQYLQKKKKKKKKKRGRERQP
jgi:hypothetical protein